MTIFKVSFALLLCVFGATIWFIINPAVVEDVKFSQAQSRWEDAHANNDMKKMHEAFADECLAYRERFKEYPLPECASFVEERNQ